MSKERKVGAKRSSFRLDEDTKRKLRLLAEKSDRSMAGVIRQLVSQAYDNEQSILPANSR